MYMENMDQILPGEELPEASGELPEEPTEEFAEEPTVESTEEPTEEPAEDVPCEEKAEPTEKKKIPVWKIATAAVSMLLLLCVLAVGLLYGMGKRWEDFFPENDLSCKESFAVSDQKAADNASKVVARIGDMTLTNDVLNILYWSTVSQYYSSYYSYMDLTTPLAEQTCIFDETLSWEQFCLQAALENWHVYAALYLQAEADGYQYEQELLDELEAMPESLVATAEEYGMDSVDALVKESYGAGATEAGYLRYDEVLMKSMTYFYDLYEQQTPTDEDVEAFFEQNATEYEAAGYGKDAGNCADVRHILIKVDSFMPTDEQTAEDSTTETTEETTAETTEETTTETPQEVWDACYGEAVRILELWKSGEATEESFAALAQEYTDDTGSVSTGGLYEDIMPGSGYVEPFLEWSVSEERQAGDTGIVQVDDYYQGYHIMYYVGGEPVWYLAASSDLLTERMTQVQTDAMDAYPMETDYKKIVLGSIDLG